MTVWIDGVESSAASIPVTDRAVQRGDGCFEVLRAYGGVAFALDEHLARLATSASLLELSLADGAVIAETVGRAAAVAGDGLVRVLATRGADEAGPGRLIVISEPLPPTPSSYRLATVVAPWHSAGRRWDLAGAKTLSYAPNLAAGRAARRRGFDDALLLSDSGVVLEGPTFSVGWFVGGVLETPALDLLILDSITRRHVLAAAEATGIPVRTGRYDRRRPLEADEVFAMSTIKEVSPVTAIDNRSWEPGPFTERLAAAFAERVVEAVGSVR